MQRRSVLARSGLTASKRNLSEAYWSGVTRQHPIVDNRPSPVASRAALTGHEVAFTHRSFFDTQLLLSQTQENIVAPADLTVLQVSELSTAILILSWRQFRPSLRPPFQRRTTQSTVRSTRRCRVTLVLSDKHRSSHRVIVCQAIAHPKCKLLRAVLHTWNVFDSDHLLILYHSHDPSSSSLLSNGLTLRPAHHDVNYVSDSQCLSPNTPQPYRTHLSLEGYETCTGSPRAFFPTHQPGFNSPRGVTAYHQRNMQSTAVNERGNQHDCTRFPFNEFQHIADVKINGICVEFDIKPRMVKGFFRAPDEDRNWTCYRRNYFSVSCTYSISPQLPPGGTMTVTREGVEREVKAIGIRMSAAVDGADCKNVELVQYTAKRDAGQKEPIALTKVLPTIEGVGPHLRHGHPHVDIYQHHAIPTTPNLPFQYLDDGPPPSSSNSRNHSQQPAQYVPGYNSTVPNQNIPPTSVTFDRIQFKNATANNGKRRASQQYFHLTMEIYVDIRERAENGPEWVKVAQRVSGRIVVRGRSPSHYNDERAARNVRHSSGSGGSGFTVPMPSGSYTGPSSSLGTFRDGYPLHHPQDHSRYDYRDAHQEMDVTSGSESAGEGISDDETYNNMAVRSHDVHYDDLAAAPSYSYHPGANLIHSQRLLAKVDEEPRCTAETRWPFSNDYPAARPPDSYNGLAGGRMHGLPTSRDSFPNLREHFGSHT